MSILSRSREYVPDGNEQRRHYRTDDKTAETESGDAGECGNQHKEVPASVSLPTRSGEKSCRLSPSRGHRTPAERRPAKRHRITRSPNNRQLARSFEIHGLALHISASQDQRALWLMRPASTFFVACFSKV